MKKQQDCCDQILKRLDKLDDILAALKNLQGENDKLEGELNDLRNQHNMLRDQVDGLPKPLTEQADHQDRQRRRQRALSTRPSAGTRNSPCWVSTSGPRSEPSRTGDFTMTGTRPVLLAFRR